MENKQESSIWRVIKFSAKFEDWDYASICEMLFAFPILPPVLLMFIKNLFQNLVLITLVPDPFHSPAFLFCFTCFCPIFPFHQSKILILTAVSSHKNNLYNYSYLSWSLSLNPIVSESTAHLGDWMRLPAWISVTIVPISHSSLTLKNSICL